VQDIADAYIESWKLGLKAVAIYRDGSKGTQPLNVSVSDKDKKDEKAAAAAHLASAQASSLTNSNLESVPATTAPAAAGSVQIAELLAAEKSATQAAQNEAREAQARLAAAEAHLAQLLSNVTGPNKSSAAAGSVDAEDSVGPPRAIRHRLPAERASVTHKFAIAGHEGYVTVGLYPNGQPGEIFIRMAKEGSTISGLMDSFATATSMCLQHGVPLKLLVEKFSHTRFEPSGWTGNEQIGYAKSIMDYLFRWMQLRFLSGQQLDLFASMKPQPATTSPVIATEAHRSAETPESAPANISGTLTNEPTAPSEPWALDSEPSTLIDRRPPQEGIAPDLSSRSGLMSNVSASNVLAGVEDRGVFHASDAMKGMYDMGDAPSCSTCGAIMVRNGACHRCMECGSTSGCS
jgi:ribonucleoside-diphosphate reductase alpha chain